MFHALGARDSGFFEFILHLIEENVQFTVYFK